MKQNVSQCARSRYGVVADKLAAGEQLNRGPQVSFDIVAAQLFGSKSTCSPAPNAPAVFRFAAKIVGKIF
jgi:hypothetical protein